MRIEKMISDDLKPFIVINGTSMSGSELVVLRFKNGVGSTVIKGKYTMGLEMAMVEFESMDSNTYTRIERPIGNLTKNTLNHELDLIKNKRERCKHENKTYWNHSYHSKCLDCGSRDI